MRTAALTDTQQAILGLIAERIEAEFTEFVGRQ